MLNEYVIKFKCKKCNHNKVAVFPCSGSISVMKAGLKNPEPCKNCGKSVWDVWGILSTDTEDM